MKKNTILFLVALILFLILMFAFPIRSDAKTKKQTQTHIETLINMGEFKVTYYCSCSECSGCWGTQTSTGKYCKQGRTVAVDPDVIDYGSRILIDDNEYVAEDCGAAVIGDHVDIYVDDHETVEALGTKYKKIWVVR